MTAVLLASASVGESAWIYLRRRRSIRVTGMLDGDRLRVVFGPAGGELSIVADGTFPAPVEADRVKAVHELTAYRENGSGVSVDLVA